MATKVFGERLRALVERDSDVEAGGTLSVWMTDAQIAELTTLASEVGISRSAMARELLVLAIPMAWKEIRPDLEQRHLFPEVATGPLEAELDVRETTPRVRKAVKRAPAKPRRKAVKGRSRAKGK